MLNINLEPIKKRVEAANSLIRERAKASLDTSAFDWIAGYNFKCAHQDIPALIAEVEALRAEAALMEEVIECVRNGGVDAVDAVEALDAHRKQRKETA